jgi:hypothetical protein
MFRFPWQNKGRLLKDKLDLIDYAFKAEKLTSFADLGGIWGVEGGYTFHALDKHPVSKGVLVDTHPTEITTKKSKNYPNLQLIQGNFGSVDVARQVGPVDAIFLIDVLLHQVRPDWNQVLEIYAQQCRCLIIYNQQWIGSDSTVRLLDLGEDEYFNNVPHKREAKPYHDLFQKLDQKHPDHDRPWRDVHHIWQWGITDDDLEKAAEKLGFRLLLKKNCGRFAQLKNFENHAFVFAK